MGLLRPLLLAAAALGVAQLCGLSVVEWFVSSCTVLYGVLSTLLAALWQLLQPSGEQQAHLPDLHQAILNVTRDASRVADLLQEFMAQYPDDPGLKDKFMAFMALQANTSYSVVDNKLSWVLWLYSVIWMPLLMIMCITRASGSGGRGSRRAGHSAVQQQQQAGTAGAQRLGSMASAPVPAVASAEPGAAGTLLPGRPSFGGFEPAGAGAAVRPGDASSVRSGSVRSMRRSATMAAHAQLRSHDGGHPGGHLPSAASLPQQVGSSKRSVSSMPISRGGVPASVDGDVLWARNGDQQPAAVSERGSLRSFRSLKVRTNGDGMYE